MFYRDNDDFFDDEEDTLKEDLALFETYLRGETQMLFMSSDRLEGLIEYYVNEDQPSQAILACNYGLSHFPYDPLFKIRKAISLSELGHLKEAIELLASAEELMVDRFEILLAKAIILRKQNKIESVIQCLQEAITLTDDSEIQKEILLELATEYRESNKFSDAIAVLTDIVYMDSKDVEIVFELASCYEQINELQQAIKCFTDFLDQEPYSHIGWYYLGMFYVKNDEPQKAIDAYQYCVAIDDKFAWAYYNMGEVYMDQNNMSEAIAEFQTFLNIEPDDVTALCLLGECYEELNDLEKAEYYYRKCISISPSYSDAWLGLGVLEDIRGNIRSSISFMSKAKFLNPNDPEILYLLGNVYIKDGLIQEAQDNFLQALKLKPDYQDCLIDYLESVNKYFHPPFIDNKDDILTFIDEYLDKYGVNRMIPLLKVNQLWLSDRKDEAFSLFRDCMDISIDYVLEVFNINEDARFVNAFEQLVEAFKKPIK